MGEKFFRCLWVFLAFVYVSGCGSRKWGEAPQPEIAKPQADQPGGSSQPVPSPEPKPQGVPEGSKAPEVPAPTPPPPPPTESVLEVPPGPSEASMPAIEDPGPILDFRDRGGLNTETGSSNARGLKFSGAQGDFILPTLRESFVDLNVEKPKEAWLGSFSDLRVVHTEDQLQIQGSAIGSWEGPARFENKVSLKKASLEESSVTSVEALCLSETQEITFTNSLCQNLVLKITEVRAESKQVALVLVQTQTAEAHFHFSKSPLANEKSPYSSFYDFVVNHISNPLSKTSMARIVFQNISVVEGPSHSHISLVLRNESKINFSGSLVTPEVGTEVPDGEPWSFLKDLHRHAEEPLCFVDQISEIKLVNNSGLGKIRLRLELIEENRTVDLSLLREAVEITRSKEEIQNLLKL